MNIAPFIFIGLLATFSISWFGYVFRPFAEFSRQQPFVDPITSAVYPIGRSGQALQGAEVYRANGCAACHTQQVRPAEEAKDILRGFGPRRTTSTDYMLDNPPQLGSIRLGPDLSNFGMRKTTNDVNWIYVHLLAPKAVVANSVMPQYPYFFDKVPTNTTIKDILRDPKDSKMPYLSKDTKNLYIPNDDARSLAAYLLSLRYEGSVFEAPAKMPATNTNAPAGGTNAPVANTTAPAPAANTNAAK